MTDKPDAKMVLGFGIRTLFDRRGNPMGRWCIHCNAYVTPDLDKSHLSCCPYAALAASQRRVEALETQYHELLLSVETKHEGETAEGAAMDGAALDYHNRKVAEEEIAALAAAPNDTSDATSATSPRQGRDGGM